VLVLLAKDPLRYSGLMPLTILEKLVYTVPVALLYLSGRVNASIMWPSLVDPVFGTFFAVAYFQMTARQHAPAGSHVATQ
jgi:hypothetical protein